MYYAEYNSVFYLSCNRIVILGYGPWFEYR